MPANVNTMWVNPGVPPSAPPPNAAPSSPDLSTPMAARHNSVGPRAASRPPSRIGGERTARAPPAASHSPIASPTPTPFTRASSALPLLATEHTNNLPPKPAWGAPNKPSSRNKFLPNKPSPSSSSSQQALHINGTSSSDQESVVDATLNNPSSQKTEEGANKRKREKSPPFVPNFEWQPEPEPEQEVAGYFDLSEGRVVDLPPEFADGKEVSFLPLPLPSKRSKNRTGARAVLIPAQLLPVYPLPPLPHIKDQELLKQVFTHASLFERDNRLFEYPDDKPARHYEKLEHVGDAILGHVVTTWLHEMQPNLTCGTATKLKAHLVSNATLSHISGLYNFPARMNGDPRLLMLLRAQTDTRAAIVEAYIAALYFSYPVQTRDTEGLAVIKAWLRELFDPLYDFFLNFMRLEYQQHYSAMGAGIEGVIEMAVSPEQLDKMDAKAEGMALLLNMWAKVREHRIEWECDRHLTGVGELWRIRVYIDGVLKGDAIRAFVQRAKNAAAMHAARKVGLAEPLL
ncbi:hypothetical protein CcaverHIS002_0106380 [Cutaneotrichosporon cavernicola]|nr:hypothetical protein CcaverHIS002_0106380 [Cutaneotrichosporon cavernicola]